MTEENKGKNASKKPFKQTRQLVKMALNDGWTQSDVAIKCRVHQSIVSGWKNGSKFGTETQLSALLEIYGHKLRRNTFKVYWHIDNETDEKTYFRVEGRVILTENIVHIDERSRIKGKPLPALRLIIHYQGNGKFRAIVQSRIRFKKAHQSRQSGQADELWSSVIKNQLNVDELIDNVDKWSDLLINNDNFDAATIPFQMRQSLLNNGFKVEGIEDFPSAW